MTVYIVCILLFTSFPACLSGLRLVSFGQTGSCFSSSSFFWQHRYHTCKQAGWCRWVFVTFRSTSARTTLAKLVCFWEKWENKPSVNLQMLAAIEGSVLGRTRTGEGSGLDLHEVWVRLMLGLHLVRVNCKLVLFLLLRNKLLTLFLVEVVTD